MLNLQILRIHTAQEIYLYFYGDAFRLCDGELLTSMYVTGLFWYQKFLCWMLSFNSTSFLVTEENLTMDHLFYR